MFSNSGTWTTESKLEHKHSHCADEIKSRREEKEDRQVEAETGLTME